MEEANIQVLRSLRDRIRAGTCRGEALLEELRIYGGSMPDPDGDDLAYDSLDTLVQGLVDCGLPPREPGPSDPETVPYQPTPARLILDLVTRAAIGPEDVFVDIGSGLGHVAILVALLTGARTLGVECEHAYYAKARSCAEGLGLSNVEFEHEDARRADFAAGTVFYLYTPFCGETLHQVLGKLRWEAQARSITLWTYGPCTRLVAQEDWLELISGRTDCEGTIAGFQSR